MIIAQYAFLLFGGVCVSGSLWMLISSGVLAKVVLGWIIAALLILMIAQDVFKFKLDQDFFLKVYFYFKYWGKK